MNLFNYAGTDISQETASVEPSNMQPNFQQPFYSNSTPTCYAQTMNNDVGLQVMNAIQQITSQNNQFVAQSSNELKKSIMENNSLRMTLERLKKERQGSPAEYSIMEGFGKCFLKGVPIPVGKIKILRIVAHKISKDGAVTDYLYIVYTDSKGNERHTTITEENLTEKKLVSKFPGFEYICNNVKTANGFLAWYISEFYTDVFPVIIPDYAGFMLYKENDTEKASFCCNDHSIHPAILQHCSTNITKNVLVRSKNTIEALTADTKLYLNTPLEVATFALSVCGALSTPLAALNYSVTQMIAISSPDADTTRQAGYYLSVFNRGQASLSFDSNKTKIKNMLHSAKDDVIVINDCSMIDNEKRRSDILQCILEWNCDNETQPHITTVFSDFAQYLIPENKKVCFALSDTFYKEMTQEEEQKMCHALDCIMRYLIDTVCEDYTKFKEALLNRINFYLLKDERCQQISLMQSKTSFAIWCAIAHIVVAYLNLTVSLEEVQETIFHAFTATPKIAGDSDDAITNDFSNCLRSCINSNSIKILLHSKSMNFVPNTPQIIVKDDLLMIEEKNYDSQNQRK